MQAAKTLRAMGGGSGISSFPEGAYTIVILAICRGRSVVDRHTSRWQCAYLYLILSIKSTCLDIYRFITLGSYSSILVSFAFHG